MEILFVNGNLLTSSITVANRSACPAAGPHGPKVGVIGSVIHLSLESHVEFVSVSDKSVQRHGLYSRPAHLPTRSWDLC